MKIIKNILITIGIIGVCCFQIYFLGNLNVSEGMITNSITIFSILFGFYITSLAIFATSKYVSELYKISDLNNKTLTLLHTLLERYKKGLIVILFSIIYLLIVLFITNNQTMSSMEMSQWPLWPFSSVIIFNFFYSYLMLSDLIKIILQEAKR